MSYARKNIFIRKRIWPRRVTVQVCPHPHRISPSWRDEEEQHVPGLAQHPLPALCGSVTFRVKEAILVFNSLDYTLISGLFLQIKIQIQNKPIPFAPICPYQYSL